MLNQYKKRSSGIELLKIIAVFMIMLSHSTPDYGFDTYLPSYFDLNYATTDIQTIVMIFMKYLGQMGNTIFVVCSAYFLLDSNKARMNKVVSMIADCYLISIMYLLAVNVLDINVGPDLTRHSLFPVTYDTNWFVSCYIVFYLLHPVLNKVIYSLEKKQLLHVMMVLVLFYSVLDTIFTSDNYCYSDLLGFVVIYFIVAYVKLYLKSTGEKNTSNVICLLLGLVGYAAQILITNIVGLRVVAYEDMMLHWNRFMNPFNILIALSLFQLFKKLEFTNCIVNYVASFSLLMYVAYENILFRLYLRPYYYAFAYAYYGNERFAYYAFLLALMSFGVFLVICIGYDVTVRKIWNKLFYKLYMVLNNAWKRLIDYCVKFD
ncbi:MAG: acyltransferase family protein [Lachnospiraceae bacterium]|nr:acyltransferase family protein [Lachnospiraceae bacterium]